MIDFSTLKELTIPEGAVIQISNNATILWERPGLLPSAYQQVEYIQTDGNQAIDTGIKASDYQDGLEYVFEGCCTGLHSSKSNNYMFGCLYGNKRSCNPSYVDKDLIIMIGSNSNGNYRVYGVALNVDFTLQAKGTSKVIADFTASYNDKAFSKLASEYVDCDMPSANIYLLACNINGNYYSSSSAPFTGKLYAFTMADMNGNALRNFIPCYRKSDGVIGLYDTVGKTFYTNIGSGNFTKGDDV